MTKQIWWIGRKHTLEARKKISEHNSRFWLGKKHSLATRKKMSLAKKGRNIIPPIVKGMKHTLATRRKMSEQRRGKPRLWARELFKGEGNPNWRGGVSDKNEIIRKSRDYKLWRKAVYERDNYICQICGDGSGGNLQADHINPFSLFPELRFAINNGRTLCKSCHIRYGWSFFREDNPKRRQ